MNGVSGNVTTSLSEGGYFVINCQLALSAERTLCMHVHMCESVCRCGLNIYVTHFFFSFLTNEGYLLHGNQVTSREAGDTRSHSARDLRLCHCSTAVRWVFSIRLQWLDSEGPEEYWPMTILPMKSLLLFML